MRIDFTDFDFQGPSEKYLIEKGKIAWIGITRNTPSSLSKSLEKPIRNFNHQFIINIFHIRNLSEINRLLFTLWKLRKESGTVLSCYIAEVKNSNSEYNLIFFQRKGGENVRVYRTDKRLEIEKDYRIEIIKIKHIIRLKIFYGPTLSNLYVDSGDLEGYDESYNELIMAQGHGFTIDNEDSSTGYIEKPKLEILEEDKIIDVKEKEIIKKEYEYDVFIAYYQISGKDFAAHLWEGLDDSNLKPFRDEENIHNSEEWKKARDEALNNCKVFILLMTPGYQNRPELIYEIKAARENKIPILYVKDANLSNNHLCMKLGEENINFTDYQLIMFNTKEELFRKVYYQLDEDGWFPSECNNDE